MTIKGNLNECQACFAGHSIPLFSGNYPALLICRYRNGRIPAFPSRPLGNQQIEFRVPC